MYQVMNPQQSEEIVTRTQVTEVKTETTVTYSVAPVAAAQITTGASGPEIPINVGYQPQQYPLRYSYNSSGYQHSFLNYQECPINFDRPDYSSPPTRAQEVYNLYCLNDHANHMARRAYEKGWITVDSVKKTYHRGLGETFDAYRGDLLAPHYVDNMINYGKFYKYLL